MSSDASAANPFLGHGLVFSLSNETHGSDLIQTVIVDHILRLSNMLVKGQRSTAIGMVLASRARTADCLREAFLGGGEGS